MKLFALLLIALCLVAVATATFYPEPWGNDQDAGNNNLDNANNITANNFIGTLVGNISGNITATNMPWTGLYDYPVACPAWSALTQLNDSVTCTAGIWAQNGSYFYYNVSSARIGIGTSSPAGTLHVDATGRSNAFVVNDATGAVGIGLTTPTARLQFNHLSPADSQTTEPADTDASIGLYRNTNINFALMGVDGGGNTWFNNRIGGDYNFWSEGALIFRLQTDGNVGIGTDSPAVKLEVNGGRVGLSNIGITHPFTDLFPTNVYGGFFPNSNASGGLVIDGLSDIGSASGMIIRGFIGSTNPTDTVAAVGFRSGKSDGATGKADLGALETAYQFSNNNNSIKYLTILGGGNVFIGDTANTKMTKGLTINQGANDDEIFSLKSSDVSHGITSWIESDTYFLLKKSSADGGGALVRGISDGDYIGLQLNGIIGNNTPTESAIVIKAHKYNGATAAEALGDDETVLAVQNGPTVVFDILGDGRIHSVDLEGTYTGGSAFVCVYNNGTLYASDSACP